MQRLEKVEELRYLSDIMEVYKKHNNVDFVHEHGNSSGFVRFRNYLQFIGKWAKKISSPDELTDESEYTDEVIEEYMKKFNIPKIQACLISMIKDVLDCNAEIEKGATQEELKKFIVDLHSFTQKIEAYLPEETVNKLHDILFKNIPKSHSTETPGRNQNFFGDSKERMSKEIAKHESRLQK